MNYTECFNRSRAAICLQPVFLSSRSLYVGTDGILRPVPFAPVPVPLCWHGWSITPCAICARSGASMLARMEYYALCHLRPFRCLHVGTDGVLRPVPFVPVQVPPCWHGWSIMPRAICARLAALLYQVTHIIVYHRY